MSPTVVDDRRWPPWAAPFSTLLVVLFGAGAVAGVLAMGSPLAAVAAVVDGALGAALVRFGGRRTVVGRRVPRGTVPLLILGVLATAVGSSALGDGGLLVWFLALTSGVFVGNLMLRQRAKSNRDLVDAQERAEAVEFGSPAPPPSGTDATAYDDLRSALGSARARTAAWLLAGVAVVGTCRALDTSLLPPLLAGLLAATFGGFAARSWIGIVVALRSLGGGGATRRAWVGLILNPAPRAVRPLLAVWHEPPRIEDGRLARPEAVYLCDDSLDDLVSTQSSLVVHEAWVQGAQGRPRWVVGDRGVAVPHRRAILFARTWFGNVPEVSRRVGLSRGTPVAPVSVPQAPGWPRLPQRLAVRCAVLAALAAGSTFID